MNCQKLNAERRGLDQVADNKISREISYELYKLLKEPLKLHDECISFTLECNLENAPKVTEEYWVCDINSIESDEREIIECSMWDLYNKNSK